MRRQSLRLHAADFSSGRVRF